jgi:MinD superfamily P-loop ATPase
MKELVVISGKGGTGKTSIVASFAALAQNCVLADCDVDAADLHLILTPEIKQNLDFSGGKRASIMSEKCLGCGKCAEVCNFGAILSAHNSHYTIDEISCEGCGVCTHFCPANAIEFTDTVNGKWFISETRFGPMVHAKLGVAQENTGKLVSLIRKEAKKIAASQNRQLLIVDGSPGIGCPVIASITAADFVLVVSEPTLSGQHDFERVAELTQHFNIPTALCVNKYDINPELTEELEQLAARRGVMTVGRVQYDNALTKAQLAAKSVVEYCDNAVTYQIKDAWNHVNALLQQEKPQ